MERADNQLEGVVERITFRNDDNGWSVIQFKADQGRSHVAVGHFASLNPGEHYQIFGQWIHHKAYGRQFKIDRAVPIRPRTKEGIVRYLASGLIEGVGLKTAEKIVNHFGTETLSILDDSPRRLLEVPTIGKKKLGAAIEAWRDKRDVNRVMMFLHRCGITASYATRIHKLYKDDSIALISENPYRLAYEIRGIGFTIADRIAQTVGIDPDSPVRIDAAIRYLMKKLQDSGHCYGTYEQIVTELSQVLALDDDISGLVLDGLARLVQQGHVIREVDGEDVMFYLADVYVAETEVSHHVARLLGGQAKFKEAEVRRALERLVHDLGSELSDHQSNAVVMALLTKVFILTGGPGVGKTTTAKVIIQMFKRMGMQVALAAPTGRAAQRMAEVSKLPAKTLHRLLEWQPGGLGFQKCSEQPLAEQVIICDEASMIDVFLAAALLDAVRDGAHLIFIGDADQLPSVGPGNVLRDLLASEKVPQVTLTEVFRQAATSRIITSAHAINSGGAPDFLNEPSSDCMFIRAQTPAQVQDTIRRLIQERIPARYGLDPVEEIQILTPMNRGDLGTQAFNEMMQAALNPGGPHLKDYKAGATVLRPGDKVIQTVNNYDLGVFNGDIGLVKEAGVEGGKLIVRYLDKQVIYSREEASELKLAYAITIHKSQGSEFPAVIIPIHTQHFIMLERNLIYTALTRAKALAIFVGTEKALSMAIQNTGSHKRQTLLKERLLREDLK